MYRDLVFAAAERVFAEAGFEGATMQAIAAEAGISLKTLYATFPGKDAVYREIRKQRAREFLEHATKSVEDAGSVTQRLVRGTRAYVDFLLTHRDYFRIQLREGRGWGLDPADDSRSEWQSGVALQATLVREGIDEGVFYDGDAELMAATAIAIMQVQLAGLLERAREADAAAISAEIVRQLARYLCKPQSLAVVERDIDA